MSAVVAKTERRFELKRGALVLRVHISDESVCANLSHPRRKKGVAMLSFATCVPGRARIDYREAPEPVLWIGSAAFDLFPREVEPLQQALESLTTKPAATAAH